jgi:Predicted metal-dependent membrane protease
MNANNIFFNESGHLRSGLRVTIFILSFLLASFVLVIAVGAPLAMFLNNKLLAFIVPSCISAAVAVFFGWLYGKIFEKVPLSALGIELSGKTISDLSLGMLIGGATFVIAALFAYLFGGMRFEANQTSGASAIAFTLAATFLVFAVAGFSEESVFRGYPLQTLSRSGMFRVGLILTSFLFATAHNSNPGATAFSWFNTFLAGVWLAVAYYKTRNLWFPTGVHVAWNWLQSAFFGINVSGLTDLAPDPILRVVETGNDFIGGGDYGIEGGIACTFSLAVSTAAIYFLPIKKSLES